MRSLKRYALPCVGILALTATGCASTRKSSDSGVNPAARQVTASQRTTEQALASATEAQKRASAQQRRATEAQKEVREAQRRLDEAQRRAEAETNKAREAQQQANEATRQATQQAQQAQQQASQQLANQAQIVARGEQLVAGQVTRASPTQLVVEPRDGQAMTFTLTPDTRVQIDGRQASATEIVQGGEARVAYEVTGTEPTARSVHIMTGNAPAQAPQETEPRR